MLDFHWDQTLVEACSHWLLIRVFSVENLQGWWHIHILNKLFFVEFLLGIQNFLGYFEWLGVLLLFNLNVESIRNCESFDVFNLFFLHLGILLKNFLILQWVLFDILVRICPRVFLVVLAPIGIL